MKNVIQVCHVQACKPKQTWSTIKHGGGSILKRGCFATIDTDALQKDGEIMFKKILPQSSFLFNFLQLSVKTQQSSQTHIKGSFGMDQLGYY